jgi:hypothetical protein
LSSPIENTSSGTGTGSTASAGNIITLGVNSLIHVASATDSDPDSATSGPGYTLHNLGPDPGGSDKTATQHRVAVTAGSYGTTMNNVNDSWAAVAVVFASGGLPVILPDPPTGLTAQ